MEVTGWIARLLEIVEEGTLFAAELEGVSSPHLRQRRRVGPQRVCKVGVHTALVIERSPGGVHQKPRHAYDAVSGVQNGGEAVVDWVGVVGVPRPEDAIDGQPRAEQGGGPNAPVILERGVVDGRQVIRAVVELAVAEDQRRRTGAMGMAEAARQMHS